MTGYASQQTVIISSRMNSETPTDGLEPSGAGIWSTNI